MDKHAPHPAEDFIDNAQTLTDVVEHLQTLEPNSEARQALLGNLNQLASALHQTFSEQFEHSPERTALIAAYLPLAACGDKDLYLQVLRTLTNIVNQSLTEPYVWQALANVLTLAGPKWLEWTDLEELLRNHVQPALDNLLAQDSGGQKPLEITSTLSHLLASFVDANCQGIPKDYKNDLYQQIKRFKSQAKTCHSVVEYPLQSAEQALLRVGSDETTCHRHGRRAQALGQAGLSLTLAGSKILGAAGAGVATFGVGSLAAFAALPDLVDAGETLKQAGHTKDAKQTFFYALGKWQEHLWKTTLHYQWTVSQQHDGAVQTNALNQYQELLTSNKLRNPNLSRKVIWGVLETLIAILTTQDNALIQAQTKGLIQWYFDNEQVTPRSRSIQRSILVLLARTNSPLPHQETADLLLSLLNKAADNPELLFPTALSLKKKIARKEMPHREIKNYPNLLIATLTQVHHYARQESITKATQQLLTACAPHDKPQIASLYQQALSQLTPLTPLTPFPLLQRARDNQNKLTPKESTDALIVVKQKGIAYVKEAIRDRSVIELSSDTPPQMMERLLADRERRENKIAKKKFRPLISASGEGSMACVEKASEGEHITRVISDKKKSKKKHRKKEKTEQELEAIAQEKRAKALRKVQKAQGKIAAVRAKNPNQEKDQTAKPQKDITKEEQAPILTEQQTKQPAETRPFFRSQSQKTLVQKPTTLSNYVTINSAKRSLKINADLPNNIAQLIQSVLVEFETNSATVSKQGEQVKKIRFDAAQQENFDSLIATLSATLATHQQPSLAKYVIIDIEKLKVKLKSTDTIPPIALEMLQIHFAHSAKNNEISVTRSKGNIIKLGFGSGAQAQFKALVDKIKKTSARAMMNKQSEIQDALVAACEAGNINKVKLLHSAGAEFTKPDTNGVYPLIAACRVLAIDIIDYIEQENEETHPLWCQVATDTAVKNTWDEWTLPDDVQQINESTTYKDFFYIKKTIIDTWGNKTKGTALHQFDGMRATLQSLIKEWDDAWGDVYKAEKMYEILPDNVLASRANPLRGWSDICRRPSAVPCRKAVCEHVNQCIDEMRELSKTIEQYRLRIKKSQRPLTAHACDLSPPKEKRNQAR